MLFGVAYYSFLIGIIGVFFTTKETKQSVLAKRLANLEEFAIRMNVGVELQESLRQAITYSSRTITYLW